MLIRSLILALAMAGASSHAWSCASASGIDFSHFDRNVRMQDDLFSAVNGRWVDNTLIPPDQASYGAFNQLQDLNLQRSRKLIEQAARAPDSASEQGKIGALYRSFMHSALLERRGIQPLRSDLQRIAAVRDLTALSGELGRLQATGVDQPLLFSVAPDAKNARVNLLQLGQSGLGLPNRDYYLQDDTRLASARLEYERYLKKLFTLAGFSGAQQRARQVIGLETAIARAQWSNVDNRDPLRTYNPLSLPALQTQAPELDWPGLLRQAQLPQVDRLNLLQPAYVRQLATLLQQQPLAVWRDYLRARLLDAYAPYLSAPFSQASFGFHQQALSGASAQRPRWKRGVALVDAAMGQALGKLYVQQYFPASSKQRVTQLVDHLLAAYAQSIATLPWMTPATREQAQAKLAKYRVKIAYPQRWRDYAALQIRERDLLGNVRRIAAFEYAYQTAKLGRPVDRDEWQMTPQTVNAYYDPQLNEIVFPAAILQAPFFNPDADDAVNYGGIGAVIGHEISHGFDDQGSQYDGDGNLHDGWNAQDRARFNALAGRLVSQYAAYEPLPGHHVNGQLTLGENIADNAGLAIAYKAYQLSLKGRPAPRLDGLSGDQRFFIGFAQVWRNKVREQQQLKLLLVDPHAPARYRPLGAAVNADAFYQAFDLKPGDRMYKPVEQRIHIW